MSDELEDYWDLVRVKSPIRRVSDKASDIEGQLELACEKAIFDLKQKFDKHRDEKLTQELLGEMIAQGVRLFMKHWLEGLRSKNVAGLIEIVLEGQKDLTPAEMQAFVRALPQSLLQKVCESGLGTANGVHALIGVEHARRRGEVREYTLGRDGFRLWVKFENAAGNEVHFFLDEPFEMDD